MPSKNQSESKATTDDSLPRLSHPSQVTENKELKHVTEERDTASSLTNQLTKEKIELKAQFQRMAIELERASMENNSLRKERLQMENKITSLLKERDNALLLIKQLTRVRTFLET